MNYSDPYLIEVLSAEYVLGTLDGPARKRFETLMMESYTVRTAVWQWEQNLFSMTALVPKKTPRKQVWRNVKKSLKPRSRTVNIYFYANRFWQGWRGIATSVLLQLSLLEGLPFPPSEAVVHDAVINSNETQPTRIVSLNMNEDKFNIVAINTEADAVSSFELGLWKLSTDGILSSSLASMPFLLKKQRMMISAKNRSELNKNKVLSLSLEKEEVQQNCRQYTFCRYEEWIERPGEFITQIKLPKHRYT